ncbi:MAG: DUF4065 domain-containing protein [Methanomassiliicoccaceae archaeon]|nr:DUF4065 domain-containing protein [Methanomassiliicoccaceae archaeon]
MATAIDVANFFVEIFKDSKDPLTKSRLIKFVYNAQGCSLARMNKPLFDEDLEAWKAGPAVPSVYRATKDYDKTHISKTLEGPYSHNVFSKEQLDLLMDVSLKYGMYSTSRLWELCHDINSPWGKVYIEGKRHIKIPKESIRDYFSKYEPLEGFDIDKVLKNMKSVGYRDSEGYTVLPCDSGD